MQDLKIEEGGRLFRISNYTQGVLPIYTVSNNAEYNDFWFEPVQIGNRYEVNILLKEGMIRLAENTLQEKWKNVYSFDIIITGIGYNKLVYYLIDNKPQVINIGLTRSQVNFFIRR